MLPKFLEDLSSFTALTYLLLKGSKIHVAPTAISTTTTTNNNNNTSADDDDTIIVHVAWY
jgi:hypothetical protein